MSLRHCLIIALCATAAAAQAQPAPGYSVTKSVAVGAPDRWDYVVFDPVSARVYLSHGDKVTVVDGKSGAPVGTIDVGGATHGIAAVNDLDKGYTDDGKAGVVVVFDLKTLKVLRQIKAEPDADGIVYDRKTGHVLVVTGDSGKVVVIDPKSDTVVTEIDGGGPLEAGVPDGQGKFFVDGEEKNEIVRMDLASGQADAHWPLTGCVTPHGIAIDLTHRRIFATCANAIMDVMNADTGAVIASLPIGQGSDSAGFDPVRQLAFSSNRDGTLSVIAEHTPDNFAALSPVTTKYGARTMALDPRTGRIYLAAADVTVSKDAAPTDRARYRVTPGTAQILFLDPQ